MEKENFNSNQINEIEEGERENLDVSVYAKPELLAISMRQIRLGLLEHLPMERYARPEYDWFQLEEIRLGLKSGVDVGKYDKPEIAYDLMRQIRLGLECGIDLSIGVRFSAGVLRQFRLALCDHVDISKYIRQGYDEEQLIPIREAKQNDIDIAPYISVSKRGSAIHEIVYGLEKGLDVSAYSDDELYWQQMREIRLGLEEGLDVSLYSNSLYSWRQMREIRLGLEEKIDVDDYRSLMYTSREMHKRRLKLLSDKSNNSDYKADTCRYEGFMLMIGEDWMDATVLITGDESEYKTGAVLKALKDNGVNTGIDYKAIEELEKNFIQGSIITVATGIAPEAGAKGWYEFFFDTNVKKIPKLLENGAVDYQNIKWFEVVKKGQKVAYYHKATKGKPGKRINGHDIEGLQGEELQAIEGRGIVRLQDRHTYAALTDGKIELIDGKLIVSEVLILNDVTRNEGNVDFKGSIYIKGNIQNGVIIKAKKDILVDGFIESATLEAGGDIILVNGNNAGGNGCIRANGNVMGRFFENTHVEAGKDIKANYCLNSELKAEREIDISGKFGVLAGGKYEAGHMVSAHDIGNDKGIATLVKVGKTDDFKGNISALESKKNQIKQELTILNSAYKDLQRKLKPEIRNTNQTYLKIEDAIYTKNKEMEELKSAILLVEAEARKRATANICINGTLHNGVQINIDGAKWTAERISNVTLKNVKSKISITRNK